MLGYQRKSVPSILVISLGLLQFSITHSTMQQGLHCKCSSNVQSCNTAQGVHFTACHVLLHSKRVPLQYMMWAVVAIVVAKQNHYHKLSEEHD